MPVKHLNALLENRATDALNHRALERPAFLMWGLNPPRSGTVPINKAIRTGNTKPGFVNFITCEIAFLKEIHIIKGRVKNIIND